MMRREMDESAREAEETEGGGRREEGDRTEADEE